MEFLAAAIVIAAATAVAVAVVFARRRPADIPFALLQQGMRSDVALLQQTRAHIDRPLLRGDVRCLGRHSLPCRLAHGRRLFGRIDMRGEQLCI